MWGCKTHVVGVMTSKCVLIIMVIIIVYLFLRVEVGIFYDSVSYLAGKVNEEALYNWRVQRLNGHARE